jgi:hypothetical protein
MKNFLKKNWGKISLAILLILISVLSFKTGYSYLSNDNYSPDLNPLLTIERSIKTPAWRSYRVLGFASESEQADIFRAVFYYILNLFLPTWSLSQIFALLCFALGSWFTALLASNLNKDFGKKKYSELAFLLSGIFYIGTLWTVWVYYQNMFPYITQFGFLPLVIWSIYRLVKNFNWKNALIFSISAISLTSTFVIATLFIVDIIVISFFTLIFAIFHSRNTKEVLRKSILTILLFISTQLFWIIPFVHYTINVSGDVVSSHTNRTVTTSIIDLEKQSLDGIDSARMYTRVLETTDDEAGEKYLFEDAQEYLTYDFFKFVGLIPAIFAIISMIFAVFQKKWIFVILGSISFLSWFMIKNQNPPLGGVYTFFQENIPLFKQVFRWPSSKIGQIYIYTLALLSPLGFIFFIDFLTSFLNKKILRIFTWGLFIIGLLSSLYLFNSYLFQGKLFVPRGVVSIPNEYHELGQYLRGNDSKGRILYLPTANNGYFREYDFGFIGSGFLHYIIPNPLIDMALSIGSEVGEEAMLELSNLEMAHDIEGLEEFIQRYEVEYVLIDRNLVQGRYGHSIDWKSVELLADKLERMWGDSDIELYKTNLKDQLLTESLTGEVNTFSRGYSQNPKITPLNLDIKNFDILGGKLKGTFEYEGEDVTLLLEQSVNISELPSLLAIENKRIKIQPAFPNINETSFGISKTFEPSNYDFYQIGNRIYTMEQLLSNIAVDIPYSELNTVQAIYDIGWQKENITTHIANNGKSGDCSGVEFDEDIAVQLQGLASGFSISGDTDLPCMYSSINLPQSGITKIRLNWEVVTDNTYIGYCLYSQEHGRCVNDEKYIYTDGKFGDKEIILPYRLNRNDDITLTIYAYSPTLDDIEVVFRDIEISSTANIENLSLEEERKLPSPTELSLRNGETYTASIPILYGEKSYIYQSSQKEDRLWQINDAQTKDLLKVEWENGIKHIVQGQYLNQYNTLFETNSLDRYIWYWSGKNISNIPSTLCLTYANDDKCWTEDIFLDDQVSSRLNFFRSIGDKRLDLSYRSVSYADITENVLYDFLVMSYPKGWEDIAFVPDNTTKYFEYELSNKGDTTTYQLDEQLPINSLISIPQASESGWLAISFRNRMPNILNNRVTVKGWKQGWDISEVDYDSILVVYYPNLLAYLGYIIWISVFLFSSVKLITKKNER